MVSTYIRMRCPLEQAMARYGRWVGTPELEPPKLVRDRDAIDLALVDGQWRGLAVFIFAADSWTVIEELSGGLAVRPAESWLELAEGGELVYAGYNNTVPYAQLIVVEQGRLVRQFLQDEQEPSEDVNVGRLADEAKQPFEGWLDVMAWIEEDETTFERPDEGWLWIHS